MMVYLLTFSSGMKYVGQTIRPLKTRMAAHRARLKQGSKFPLYLEWAKCGEPDASALELCATIEELNAAEEKWIASESTIAPNGLNVAAGGLKSASQHIASGGKISAALRGGRHTEESRKKVSEASKQHWQDPEYRAKVSDGVKASMTPERRREMGEHSKKVHTGRKRSAETIEKLKGRVFSDDARAKMSESAKKRVRTPMSQETKEKIAAKTKAFWDKAREQKSKMNQ